MTDQVPLYAVMSLDGAIANIAHRVHLRQAALWDEFAEAADGDIAQPDVATALRILSEGGLRIIVTTDREEKYRARTLDWLWTVGLGGYVDALLMRPNGRRGHPSAFIPGVVCEFLDCTPERIGDAVAFVIEGDDMSVEAFRALGVPTWQVR